MFIADCPEWVRLRFPKLPPEHHDEYILRLGDFVPDCSMRPIASMKTITRTTDGQYAWDFPFIMGRSEVEQFDSMAFDEHTFEVERIMIEKYNLTEESFCDF